MPHVPFFTHHSATPQCSMYVELCRPGIRSVPQLSNQIMLWVIGARALLWDIWAWGRRQCPGRRNLAWIYLVPFPAPLPYESASREQSKMSRTVACDRHRMENNKKHDMFLCPILKNRKSSGRGAGQKCSKCCPGCGIGLNLCRGCLWPTCALSSVTQGRGSSGERSTWSGASGGFFCWLMHSERRAGEGQTAYN